MTECMEQSDEIKTIYNCSFRFLTAKPGIASFIHCVLSSLSSFAPKSKDAANGLNNPDSLRLKLIKTDKR